MLHGQKLLSGTQRKWQNFRSLSPFSKLDCRSQMALDKPACLTIEPICQIWYNYKNTNSGTVTLSRWHHRRMHDFLVSSLPALEVRQMGWSLGGRANLTAHLVSIALIQLHFILGGQFSGFNCINCRELRKLCKATMQASYFSQSTRYSKDSPRLLGNAENLGHHANAIILKCRLTMFRH